jgi:hypothetical protein
MGQTFVLTGAGPAEQLQKALVFVLSCTWHSMPMTGSYETCKEIPHCCSLAKDVLVVQTRVFMTWNGRGTRGSSMYLSRGCNRRSGSIATCISCRAACIAQGRPSPLPETKERAVWVGHAGRQRHCLLEAAGAYDPLLSDSKTCRLEHVPARVTNNLVPYSSTSRSCLY